jgi:WbqC-like protein family
MVNRPATDESRQPSTIYGMNAAAKRIAAIHQPNYIPWLGYFFKIAYSDIFVFADMMAYSSGSFINRNSIKTPSGPAWLTIPVLKSGRSGQLINEVETDNIQQWAGRHLATLRSNYGRAPYFKETSALLEPHYPIATGNRSSLAAFNIGVIRSIAAYLGIGTEFINASELNLSGHKTGLLVDICRAIGASTYLAGAGGKSYQEDAGFEAVGITPVYSSFSQRRYPQLFGEFVLNLSVVDVLMNCGYAGTRRLLGIESHQE